MLDYWFLCTHTGRRMGAFVPSEFDPCQQVRNTCLQYFGQYIYAKL